MWEKIKTSSITAIEVLRAAAKAYGRDRVSRMSAAVAYRAIFAVAPLVLLAVYVFGLLLGPETNAQGEILHFVERFAGGSVREAMLRVLDSVEDTGGAAGVVGVVLLLWTSSSLFLELQNALNDIFAVPYEHTSGPIDFMRKRGLGFLFALGLGLVLVAVWLLNGIWQLLGGLFPESFEPAHRLIGLFAPLVSLVVLPFVMALAFQVLSRAKVRWRAVWWGSFFTSVSFLAAAYGTGLYFRLTGSSAAGVAGSIFVILLLAFVLAAVFLFGAEVTKVYDDYLGKGDVEPPSARRSGHQGPDVVVTEPSPPLPLAAVFAFIGGLFVGWRRNR